MSLQLVQVRWNDAWTDATEPVTLADAKADHEPKVIVTLGWLLYENEKGVKVVNEYYEDEEIYRGQTFIPRGMVIDVTPFNLVKPRKRLASAGRGVRTGNSGSGSENPTEQ